VLLCSFTSFHAALDLEAARHRLVVLIWMVTGLDVGLDLLGEFVWWFSRHPISMLVVQPIHLCERDSHSDSVVAVSAIKREKDDCVAYFRVVCIVWAFDRTAFAKAGYGFASLFCHGESPFCFQGSEIWRLQVGSMQTPGYTP
jgi:hypothetical protein